MSVGRPTSSPELPNLWVISGPPGSGKTTYCQNLLLQVSPTWRVGGILSPGVVVHGEKVGIDAWDPRSTIRQRLATKNAVPTATATPHWHFDPQVLAWGNQILATAVPCDLLLIDEIGPLELEQHQGWMAALTALASRQYRVAVMTLRPRLLPWADRWGATVIRLEGGLPQPAAHHEHLRARLRDAPGSVPLSAPGPPAPA
ncbi:MAG: hypothetical protein OHK0012_15200 [Synechococcales cyanobacterium]